MEVWIKVDGFKIRFMGTLNEALEHCRNLREQGKLAYVI